MSTEKSLDDLLAELRKERELLEERMSKANRNNGSASALSREAADDLRLFAIERKEARLLREKEQAEKPQRTRAAFDRMLDEAFDAAPEHDDN